MQGNETFRLIVRRGPQPNQTFELNKDVITLGRDITNDIVINDPEVSRHHLRFTRGASGYNMEDLGSTNGTFIGGQRMTGVRPLNRGDMIGLGETVTLGYEVLRAGMEAAPTMQNPVQPHAPSPYSPPPQGVQPPAPSGYTPPPAAPVAPQYGQQSQQPQPGYGQQDYGQQDYPPPADYGYGQPGYAPQGPPGAGYDYDPYAIREDEPRSAARWVLIGCGLLSVFCCCSSVVGIVIIDALSLWYDLPIIRSLAPLFERIANALGLL